MKKYRMRTGIVMWEDACICVREEPPHKCPVNSSVGYIKRLPNKIMVCSLMTYDNDLERGVTQIIPLGCVKKIQWLK